MVLIANAIVVGTKNSLFFGGLKHLFSYNNNLIDTVIYGFGFGMLFLLPAYRRTWGLSIVLWSWLIEAGVIL